MSPQASSMRAQSFRNARNLAMVRNWSWSAARRKKIAAARLVEIEPLSFQRAQIGKGIGQHKGKFLRLRAACRMHGSSVGDGEGPSEAFSR